MCVQNRKIPYAHQGNPGMEVADAGLRDVDVSGLLVGASIWGIDELRSRLAADYEAALEVERGFAAQPALADLGKQLLLRATTSQR